MLARSYAPNGVVASLFSAVPDVTPEVDVVHQEVHQAGDYRRRDELVARSIETVQELPKCDVAFAIHVYLTLEQTLEVFEKTGCRYFLVFAHSFPQAIGKIDNAPYRYIVQAGKELWVRMDVPGNSATYKHPLPLWDFYESGGAGGLVWNQVRSTKLSAVYVFQRGRISGVPRAILDDVTDDEAHTAGYTVFAPTWRKACLLGIGQELIILPKTSVKMIADRLTPHASFSQKLEAARRMAPNHIAGKGIRAYAGNAEHLAYAAAILSARNRVAASSGLSEHAAMIRAHDTASKDGRTQIAMWSLFKRLDWRKRLSIAAAPPAGLAAVGAVLCKGAVAAACLGGASAVAVAGVAAALAAPRVVSWAKGTRGVETGESKVWLVSAPAPPLAALLRRCEVINAKNHAAYQAALGGGSELQPTNSASVNAVGNFRKPPRESHHSTGWFVEGVVNFVFDDTIDTILNCIDARMLFEAEVEVTRTLAFMRTMEEECTQLCRLLAYVQPGRVTTWADMAEWLEPKTKARAEQLIRAYVERKPHAAAADRRVCYPFRKAEIATLVKEHVKSRLVVPATAHYQVSTSIAIGNVVNSCFEWMESQHSWLKIGVGHTNRELADWVSEAMGSGRVTASGDFSNCDARQNNVWVLGMLKLLMSEAGASEKVLADITEGHRTPLMRIQAEGPDGTTWVEFTGILSSLRSGDIQTTWANTMVLAVLALKTWRRLGSPEEVRFMCGGDDSQHFAPPGLLERWLATYAEEAEALGHKFTAEPGYGFYSSLLLPSSAFGGYSLSPLPGKVLAKTGLHMHHLGPATLSHFRGIAHNLLPHFQHVPVMRKFFTCVLRNTRDVRGRGIVGESPSRWIGAGAAESQTAATMVEFCERYDTTVAEVEAVEALLDRVNFPPPYKLTHPLFKRMVAVDVGYDFERAEEFFKQFA